MQVYLTAKEAYVMTITENWQKNPEFYDMTVQIHDVRLEIFYMVAAKVF